jgi:hypothetical protein
MSSMLSSDMGWLVAGGLGALAAWLGGVRTALVSELRRERARADTAEDRLYAAWKEGHVIPPRPESMPAPEPPAPIPAELRDLVDRWDDPLAREKAELELRGLLTQGRSVASILREYEVPRLD